MKKLLLLFVLSLTCLFALTACEGLDLGGLLPGLGGGDTETEEPTDTPTEGEKEELSAELKSVRSYLIQMYGDGSAKATAADFYRISTVPVSGVALEVVWTASDESIVISAETEGDYAGMTKVAVGAIGATQRDYVLTATVTDSEGNVLELEFNCYVPAAEASTIAAFIESKDEESYKALTGVVTAVNKVGSKGSFVLTDATGSIFCYDGLDVTLGDAIVVVGQLQLYNGKFPQLKGPALAQVVSQGNDVVAISGEKLEVSAEQVKADVALGADTLIENYEGKYLAITGYAFKNANGYINLKASLTDTDACVNLYAAKEVGLTEELVDTKITVYGFMRGTGSSYLTVQVQSFVTVEEELTDEQLVQKALNAVSVTTEYSENAEVELPATSGDVQLSWELVGEVQPEFAIVEGKLVVTVANANASQTLKVTATLGEVSLTKEFNLVVTYEIVYTSIAEALAIGAAKEHNTYTSEKYYLTGTVKSIYNDQYGNLYLTDGTNEITIYGVYIEGSKYGDYTGEKFAAGDTVVLYGPLGQYNGTAQMKNADLVSWEAVGTTPDPEPTPDPELPAPGNVSIADAITVANTKEHNTYTTDKYIITGTVREIYNTTYGNLYLTDGTNEIVVYGVYIEGSKYGDYTGEKFVAGDKITVEGILGTYNSTAQMKNADLVSWEAGTPPVLEGTKIDFSSTANRTSFSTSEQVWEQNGITVTNKKGASTSNVADYAGPARFYKSSSLTIDYTSNISKIVITCAGESKYYFPTTFTLEGATVTVSGSVCTIELTTPATSITIPTLPNQVRVSKIEVVPAQ